MVKRDTDFRTEFVFPCPRGWEGWFDCAHALKLFKSKGIKLEVRKLPVVKVPLSSSWLTFGPHWLCRRGHWGSPACHRKWGKLIFLGLGEHSIIISQDLSQIPLCWSLIPHMPTALSPFIFNSTSPIVWLRILHAALLSVSLPFLPNIYLSDPQIPLPWLFLCPAVCVPVSSSCFDFSQRLDATICPADNPSTLLSTCPTDYLQFTARLILPFGYCPCLAYERCMKQLLLELKWLIIQ